MPPEINFSGDALDDLRRVIDEFWRFSPDAAQRFAESYDQAVSQLLQFPESGQVHRPGRYSIPVGRSGYRLVYKFADGQLLITRLKSMRQDTGNLF